MPKGYVKFYDEEKEFGYINGDEGFDVRIPHNVVQEEMKPLAKGTRVEFSYFDGKNGPVASSLEVLNEPKRIVEAKKSRMKPEELVPIIEGAQAILDDINAGLRKNHYPDLQKGKKIALVLRKIASSLDIG